MARSIRAYALVGFSPKPKHTHIFTSNELSTALCQMLAHTDLVVYSYTKHVCQLWQWNASEKVVSVEWKYASEQLLVQMPGMSDKYDEERCLVKAIYTAISLLSLDRVWTGAWYSCICPSRAQPKTKTHAGGFLFGLGRVSLLAKPCLPCSKAMFRATCHVNAKASSGNASAHGSCCIFVYQARVPTVAMKCFRQARKRRVKVCIRTTASTNVEMVEFCPCRVCCC